MYVGTWGLGMYRSSDGGQTFAECNTGLPLTTLTHGSQAFAHPRMPRVLYCILSGNVMYKSIDDGATWQYYSVAPGGYVLIDPHRPNRWYCAAGGLMRSLDSGRTWQTCYAPSPDTDVFGFWLDPHVSGRILAGDRNGRQVLSSENGGDTWMPKGTIPATPYGFTVFSDLCGDPHDPNVVLVAAYPTYVSNKQHGYIWRSGDGGATWSHIRDQMFYGHWRIGDGRWFVWNYAMKQDVTPYCNYRLTLDNQTFGDGTYECKMRIAQTNNDEPNHWAGFTIRMSNPDSSYIDSGWLVYMRRNGVVALFNSTDKDVINVEQTPVVADPTQWTTIRLAAMGNSFELFANGASVGTYVDANHRYDGPGYFGFVTCKTNSEYDMTALLGLKFLWRSSRWVF